MQTAFDKSLKLEKKYFVLDKDLSALKQNATLWIHIIQIAGKYSEKQHNNFALDYCHY